MSIGLQPLKLHLIVALGALLCAGPVRAERFAIVIGQNLGRASEIPLRYAELDADRMAEVLTELGGVAPERMVLLKGARAGQVEAAFEQVRERLAEATGEKLLLFYYSGHADGSSLHLGETTLELSRLKILLEDSGARVRVGVIDACQAGSLTSRAKGLKSVAPFALTAPAEFGARGQVLIAAVSGDEAAQESDALRGSYFSAAFLTGLRGAADRDAKGVVSVDAAYRYAYAQTIRFTLLSRTGAQHPSYVFDLSGQGEVILTRPGQGRARLQFEAEEAGEFAVFSGDQELVALFQVEGPGSVLLALPPGTFEVRKRSASGLRTARVELSLGDDRSLREARMPRLQYVPLARKGGVSRLQLELGASAGLLTGPPGAPVARVGLQFDLGPLVLGARASGAFHRYLAAGHRLTSRAEVTEAALQLGLVALRAWESGQLTLMTGVALDGALIQQSVYATPAWSSAGLLSLTAGVAVRLSGALSLSLWLEPGLMVTRVADGPALRPFTSAALGLRYDLC